MPHSSCPVSVSIEPDIFTFKRLMPTLHWPPLPDSCLTYTPSSLSISHRLTSIQVALRRVPRGAWRCVLSPEFSSPAPRTTMGCSCAESSSPPRRRLSPFRVDESPITVDAARLLRVTAVTEDEVVRVSFAEARRSIWFLAHQRSLERRSVR